MSKAGTSPATKRPAPLYFIYGQEDFLVEQSVQAIVAKALDEAAKGFNYDVIDGSKTDGPSLVALASAYPMMSERRVVGLREFEKLTSKESDRDSLTRYFENPLESTCLIVVAGDQTRSFCFVYDMVEGFLRMMKSDDDFLGPVNLGNPDEFSMIELAEMVLRVTGSRSKLVRKPLPLDDPKRRKPDISLARSALGWEPKVKLERGIEATVAYFDDVLSFDRAVAEGEAAVRRQSPPRLQVV